MAVKKGWEAAKTASDEAKKAAAGSGKYLRLQDDGDCAVVAFLGEPVVREVIWVGNGTEDYDPEKHKGQTPQVKFGICVYNKEHSKLQLFEQSAGTLATLLGVYEKYGQFKFWFEVKRKGAKGNKKTIYTILPDEPITPEEKNDLVSLIKNDKLIDVEAELAKGGKDDDDDADRGNASKKEEPHDSGALISEEDALNIIEKVKMLPREFTQSFLAAMEVQRVREIPASKVEKAKAFIAKIEAESKPKDVDPFK